MIRKAAASATILFFCIFAKASEEIEISAPISILRVEAASSYGGLVKAAQKSSLSFFTSLEKMGIGRGLFKTFPKGSFFPDLLFSKFENPPLKILSGCTAVFCRDLDLQKKLQEELNGGRLILVANAFHGLTAAVPAESAETRALKRMFKTGSEDKSVLVITPKTLMSTLAHELTHAEDSENQALDPLFEKMRGLYEEGQISAENGRRINQFVGEVRAYDNEMKFVLKNSRANEFVAENDEGEKAEPYQIRVHQVKKMEFVPQRIREIDWKVRNFYLGELFTGLRDKGLSVKARKIVLDLLKDHLPQGGPYSFAHLVQPRL